MTLLFYSPFNNRSRDTESLMLAFKAKGYEVISLSQAEGSYIHPFLQTKGIKTFTHVIKRGNDFIYHLRHLIHFIFFCYRHRIDVVYAHLESACFVAAIGQFFIQGKVFICRHHIDEAALQGFDKSIYYKLTYNLARTIIVVSNHAVEYMVNVEGISKNKISKINLAYDFSLYDKPNMTDVASIRDNLKCDVLLLTVGRLTKHKRVHLSLEVLQGIFNRGINAKLIVLGSGEESDNLNDCANKLGLKDKVVFFGYVQNVMNFIAASDYLIHPSVLESSCVVVKEAGLVRKPVIVCKGVGDFDDYIVHEKNGFMVESDNFVNEAINCISYSITGSTLKNMGLNLENEIRHRFDVKNLINQYTKLNSCE